MDDVDIMIDYYLPDGTPVISDDIIERWIRLGKPPIKVWSQTVTDLEAYPAVDVDLDELAVVVGFLNKSA